MFMFCFIMFLRLRNKNSPRGSDLLWGGCNEYTYYENTFSTHVDFDSIYSPCQSYLQLTSQGSNMGSNYYI